MAHIDPLLQRNKDFAATGAHETATIARFPVYVIACLDPRTDPSAFLGLEPGDAMVIRNAGGRVSPDVLKDLAYIGYLSRTIVPGGPRFEVAVVHHNQCGTHYLADGKFRRGFADLIGGDEAALAAEAVTDPEQTVRSDVELLRSAAVLPDTITVSGHVYDVTTGLVTTVVPASPHIQPRNRGTKDSARALPLLTRSQRRRRNVD
jgi:carbonic anhydrase